MTLYIFCKCNPKEWIPTYQLIKNLDIEVKEYKYNLEYAKEHQALAQKMGLPHDYDLPIINIPAIQLTTPIVHLPVDTSRRLSAFLKENPHPTQEQKIKFNQELLTAKNKVSINK